MSNKILSIKKVCGVCKQEKEIFEFHKHKRIKDGLNSCCKMDILQMSDGTQSQMWTLWEVENST